MAHLWDALGHAFDVLGFEATTGGNEVFRHLVLARIIDPSSKLDSARVLEEIGVTACSYRTLARHLPTHATESWRAKLAAACAARAGLGPATLILYDVTTLYFETDEGDGFREELEEAGLSVILGARIPDVPYAVKTWHEAHPDTEIADQQMFIQKWPAGPTDKRRDQVI